MYLIRASYGTTSHTSLIAAVGVARVSGDARVTRTDSDRTIFDTRTATPATMRASLDQAIRQTFQSFEPKSQC